MTITKEMAEKIAEKYGLTLYQLEEACNCINNILCAEANAIQSKTPYATRSIQRIESVAYEVFNLGSDISNENFED